MGGLLPILPLAGPFSPGRCRQDAQLLPSGPCGHAGRQATAHPEQMTLPEISQPDPDNGQDLMAHFDS
jgi:hypothetical protein